MTVFVCSPVLPSVYMNIGTVVHPDHVIRANIYTHILNMLPVTLSKTRVSVQYLVTYFNDMLLPNRNYILLTSQS